MNKNKCLVFKPSAGHSHNTLDSSAAFTPNQVHEQKTMFTW